MKETMNDMTKKMEDEEEKEKEKEKEKEREKEKEKEKEKEEERKRVRTICTKTNWNNISRDHGSLFREPLLPDQPYFPFLILVTSTLRHLVTSCYFSYHHHHHHSWWSSQWGH